MWDMENRDYPVPLPCVDMDIRVGRLSLLVGRSKLCAAQLMVDVDEASRTGIESKNKIQGLKEENNEVEDCPRRLLDLGLL